MEYTANLELSKSYFAENFEQWLNHRSKFRKWEVHFGLVMVGVGTGLVWLKPSAVSVAIIVFGMIQVFDFYLYRRKWIDQRVKSRASNTGKSVYIRVSESGLYQKGPTSEGTISWEGVKEAIPTSKGIFLSIGDGMSMYIPDTCMNCNEFKAFVVRMVAGDT